MTRILAYTYEAAYHCPACARVYFGADLDAPDTVDREGNPIGVLFSTDEADESGVYCDDCRREIVEPLEPIESDQEGESL